MADLFAENEPARLRQEATALNGEMSTLDHLAQAVLRMNATNSITQPFISAEDAAEALGSPPDGSAALLAWAKMAAHLEWPALAVRSSGGKILNGSVSDMLICLMTLPPDDSRC